TLGIDKVFNFDSALTRAPAAPDTAAATAWSFGFSAGGQRRFRSPSPQSYALFVAPSAAYVISEEWNLSLGMPITGRWFDTLGGVNQRNLTLEPTGIVEYVIPNAWFGGAATSRAAGNPAVDFFVGVERNWSNLSTAAYTQWRAGIVFKT